MSRGLTDMGLSHVEDRLANTITCSACGVEYGVGASPWCRDGHAGGRTASVVDDTIIGGFVQTTGTREPRVFYSHSERRAWLKANGFVEAGCHSPMGADGVKDLNCADHSGPAPHTLATLGDWLAARMGGAKDSTTAPEPMRIEVTWHDAPGASFSVERDS